MKTVFKLDSETLRELGFVPNERNRRYHTAKVTIGGHTVWTKDFRFAQKIANRVVGTLYRRGLDVQYRVDDQNGNYQYNW